jgi:hypothetical protein
MDIKDIAELCDTGALRWTNHILGRIFQRGISTDDIKNVLVNGEIIEQYPADYPFPSCLMLGRNKAGENLHVVCGSNGDELWLITAYLPDPNDWADDCRQRRK